MAAYRWVYGFGHLQADCRGLGSAPEPYAHFEYGSTLPFYNCNELGDHSAECASKQVEFNIPSTYYR